MERLHVSENHSKSSIETRDDDDFSGIQGCLRSSPSRAESGTALLGSWPFDPENADRPSFPTPSHIALDPSGDQ
jgi:hypothetical protein